MTFLNWLPEIMILMQLFFALGLLCFKRNASFSLSPALSVLNIGVLLYFGFRSDLNHFESPYHLISSDSFAVFGKFFSLLFISLVGLYLHFHRELTFYSKQLSMIFVLFSGFFLIGVFSSESIILMALSWFGVYQSLTRFVLIESKNNESWIYQLNQRTLPLALLMISFALLLLIMIFSAHSIYVGDFIGVSKNSGHELPFLACGFLIYLVLGLILFGFNFSGDSPFGMSLFSLFMFLSAGSFLVRIGIPFLSESEIFPKVYEQIFLGLILGVFSLKHAYLAFKTENHFKWLSSVLYTSVALGLFSLLLNVGHAIPLFYLIALSFLFTFLFIGNSFLETKYHNKISILMSLFGIFGLPPLVLGEQYFQLMHHLFEGGLIVPVCLFVGSWFLLSIATLRMLSRVMLVKNGAITFRKAEAGEMALIAVYFLGVIALTAFKPELISLLNDRPLPYLW